MDLHREIEAARSVLMEANLADTEMLVRAMDTSQISRQEMIMAGQIFLRDAQNAEQGNYAAATVLLIHAS